MAGTEDRTEADQAWAIPVVTIDPFGGFPCKSPVAFAEPRRIMIGDLINKANAAASKMGQSNPNRWLLMELASAVLELAKDVQKTKRDLAEAFSSLETYADSLDALDAGASAGQKTTINGNAEAAEK